MDSRLNAITDAEWEGSAKVARYSVSSLAQRTRVSRQHLRRFFQQRFGLDPKAWLDRLRMHEARRLLLRGALIKEIAYELGFRHPNHFARAFRRQANRNPAADRPMSPVARIVVRVVAGSKKVRNVPKRSVRKLVPL